MGNQSAGLLPLLNASPNIRCGGLRLFFVVGNGSTSISSGSCTPGIDMGARCCSWAADVLAMMLAVMRRPTPHNDPSFMDDSLLDTVFRVSYWMNVSLVHRANTCTELSHYRWIGAVFYRCCGISHSQFIGPSTGSFIAGRPRYTLCPRGSHSLLSRHRPAPDVNTGMLVLTWLRVRGLLRPGVPPAGGQISAG